jgi:DNA-binding beta-propeller fold protein YncE
MPVFSTPRRRFGEALLRLVGAVRGSAITVFFRLDLAECRSGQEVQTMLVHHPCRSNHLVIALAMASLILAIPAVAQVVANPTGPLPQPVCPLPHTAPPVDNSDGYFVNLEEPPIHPAEMTSDGSELWVVNIPDGSVSVFSLAVPASPKLVTEIAVCLGPITVRERPLTDHSPLPKEMWIACHSSNAVFVVDQQQKLVIDAITVEHEPAGLIFSNDGSKAFVTTSASNQVHEIDTATRSITATMEFASPYPLGSTDNLHAEEPRALVADGTDLYVLSNESGNGTLSVGALVVQAWPGAVPPDRDVIKLDSLNPGAAGSAEAWRMGTTNNDIQRLSTGELLVSSVDLLNDLCKSEPECQQLGFARHQISIAPPTGGSPNLGGTTLVDLNGANASGMPADYLCANPTEMAIDAAEARLYVACYESSNIAVLDLGLNPPQVIAEMRAANPVTKTGPFGSRGVVLNEAQNLLYAYNRGDNSLQVYPTNTTGVLVNPIGRPVSVGFDITPDEVIRGRFHHINARNSNLSGSGSFATCNTCHPDGHLDRIGWHIGATTGNLSVDPNDVDQDDKGEMITLSLRRISDTPPLHWRGDRDDLDDFNGAFAGLMGGQVLSDADLAEFMSFVFTLVYPANPDQPLNRGYSGQGKSGFSCFRNQGTPAHGLTMDIAGTLQQLTCGDCHGTDGAAGTNNQVNNDLSNNPNPHDQDGFPASAPLDEDATQLRGLFDKKSDIANVGGFRFPVTGFGFGHSHITNTVEEFVDLGVFNLLSSAQRNEIKQFLLEFDSGLARTTARTMALNSRTLGNGTFTVTNLENGAANNANDLVVRGWFLNAGVPTPIGLLYDPVAAVYVTDTATIPPVPLSTLVSSAQAGFGEFYFIGTPVASGIRLGLDRDMDALLDGDEFLNGASVRSTDTDGDGYPDGYEVRLGSNPNNVLSVPPPENVAPNIQNQVVSWVNSETAKLRWTTDEESRSRVRVKNPGTGAVLFESTDSHFKFIHTAVVREIDPAGTYDIEIESEDPFLGFAGGNKQTVTFLGVATQPHLFQSAHIEKTTIPVVSGSAGNWSVQVDFLVHDETKAPLPGAKVRFRLVEWKPGVPLTTVSTTFVSNPANGLGIASTVVPVLSAGAVTVEAIGDEVTDPASNRLHFNPLSGQFGFFAQALIP